MEKRNMWSPLENLGSGPSTKKSQKRKNVKTILGTEGRRIKESDGGVTSTMMHCENFCKCHNGLQVQQYDNLRKSKRLKKF
jgi:hypothetical protein